MRKGIAKAGWSTFLRSRGICGTAVGMSSSSWKSWSKGSAKQSPERLLMFLNKGDDVNKKDIVPKKVLTKPVFPRLS